MRLYIAGPMTGLPEYNYPAFERAGELLTAAGFEVLNPIDSDDEHDGERFSQSWEWYMRHAIRKLTEADGVATLPGWKDSRGAKFETKIARRLVMPVRSLEKWLLEGSSDLGEEKEGRNHRKTLGTTGNEHSRSPRVRLPRTPLFDHPGYAVPEDLDPVNWRHLLGEWLRGLGVAHLPVAAGTTTRLYRGDIEYHADPDNGVISSDTVYPRLTLPHYGTYPRHLFPYGLGAYQDGVLVERFGR